MQEVDRKTKANFSERKKHAGGRKIREIERNRGREVERETPKQAWKDLNVE